MKDYPFSLWVYLSRPPLLWLTITLLVYAATDAVSFATNRHPLANPALHATSIIGVLLLVTQTRVSRQKRCIPTVLRSGL
jgi:putative effector of murein hydrolase